jgi:hypothetical protein
MLLTRKIISQDKVMLKNVSFTPKQTASKIATLSLSGMLTLGDNILASHSIIAINKNAPQQNLRNHA